VKLQGCIKNKDTGVPDWFFKDHRKKMDRTQKVLPAQCSKLIPGIKVHYNRNSTAQTRQYTVWRGGNKKQISVVSIPAGLSGHFADTSMNSILDFETRMDYSI
jgi:hypothetical protein